MKRKVFAVIGILALTCMAEQLLWFDGNVTWTTSTGGRVSCITADATHGAFANVANLVSPTDFANTGKAYMKVKCLSKPTNFRMGIQTCNWVGCETCSWFDHLVFTKAGDVAYQEQSPMKDWWNKCAHDWSTGANDSWWLLIDPSVNKWIDIGGGSWCMGGSAAQHLPVTVHLWMILTTAGAQITLPSSWEGPCPPGWPCASVTAQLPENKVAGPANALVIRQLRGDLAQINAKETGTLKIMTLNGTPVYNSQVKQGCNTISTRDWGQGMLVAAFNGPNGTAIARILVF